jgi:hypothetical protein
MSPASVIIAILNVSASTVQAVIDTTPKIASTANKNFFIVFSVLYIKGESREREENLLSFIFLTKTYDYTRSSLVFTRTSSCSAGSLYFRTCLLYTLLGLLYLVKSISGWSFINARMSYPPSRSNSRFE